HILDYTKKNKGSLIGLVLTHAHEDHIGAVPYLWRELNCPIYTTQFTAEVVKSKLREFDLESDVPMNIIKPGDKVVLDPFSFELVGITHSTLSTCSVLINTKAGNIFHTGDWKLDPDPIIGEVTDEKKLEEIGDSGVLALVCDST